ncbi:helix-turn-helix domain-containing protein [Nocardioides sp. GY 10127]|uniref:PucR family transcriptional regulator n=1 Tax=Nocardioides sp. GY 10127 TaxID=2569762 RepID=UPI0010A8681D|nr:helix-turn-helix domain-containing protein [Nocardioides sp. GY 10127]TIC85717.1 PucR family transcriptional regulator [Nocardioides sp. GY 10127]
MASGTAGGRTGRSAEGQEQTSAPAIPPPSSDTLLRATGTLSTAATARMDSALPWFREMRAEDRAWVGQIVQNGVRSFVEWYAQDGADDPARSGTALAASVFGNAPRALAGAISLQQTVDLVRLSIDAIEADIDSLLPPDEAQVVHGAVLRYAREVAFAAAEVYARAAEARGAWDARLEALVVDAVLRSETDEAILSRASALGWTAHDGVVVVLGQVPERRTETDLFAEVRRRARSAGMDAMCAVQGERLVVVLGGAEEPGKAAACLVPAFGPGPVVVGPVADGLAEAHLSARSAMSGLRAAAGWPGAPRPVPAEDLMPERALAGDGHARRHLVEDVYLPLVESRGALTTTLSAYLAAGGSVEATARALFVHANTVRYRLRSVADVTGLSPTQPRDALTLSMALVLGRQSGRATETPDS